MGIELKPIPKEICLIHMQRAGGHAVMNWLIGELTSAGQSVQVYNDVGNPATLEGWREGREGKPFGREGHQVHLYNIEDCPVAEVRRRLEIAAQVCPILHDPQPTYILLLRDPWNLFASRAAFRRKCQLGNLSRKAVDCWLEHAEKYTAGCPLCLPGLRLRVSFNRWFRVREYRAEIAAALGLELTDARLQDLPPYHLANDPAEGSSFDGTRFRGRAQEMGVLDRYSHLPFTLWCQVRHNIAPAVPIAKPLFSPAEVGFIKREGISWDDYDALASQPDGKSPTSPATPAAQ